jgi:hypothetical protein
VRKRANWPARMMTLSGPANEIDNARAMADAMVLASQDEVLDQMPITPPCEGPKPRIMPSLPKMHQPPPRPPYVPPPSHPGVYQPFMMNPWYVWPYHPPMHAPPLQPPPQRSQQELPPQEINTPTRSPSPTPSPTSVAAEPQPKRSRVQTEELETVAVDPDQRGIVKIKCFVFGLDYCGAHPAHEWNDKLVNKLQDTLPRLYEVPWIDMWVDARRFNWPNFPKHHIGENEEAITIVTESPKFGDWLASIKVAFATMQTKHPQEFTFNVGVACKQGLKRSVACARILSSIWAARGFQVREPRRLSFRGGQCDGKCNCCQSGERATAMKKEALAKALEIWERS